MQTKVTIGPLSILGWLSSAGSAIVSAVQSIEHAQPLMSGASKTPAIFALVLLLGTHAMRAYQTRALPGSGRLREVEREVPAVLRELARENQARVAASPDGVDGPHVPFATLTADEIDHQAAQVAARVHAS